MSALEDVKSWMSFIGWSDGGAPGSTKRDADGREVAKAGDTTWIADVEDCIGKAERHRIIAEFERRAAR